MAALLHMLSRMPVLIGAFALFLACGALFGVFMPAAGGELLDMEMTGEAAGAILSEMTTAQRTAHIWITAILDTLYPLAYGAVLAGIAWRFGGKLRSLAILPAITGVVSDFTENTLQLAALSGSPGWLAGKDIITPLKFGAIALAGLIALVLLLTALLRRLMGRG